MDGGDRLGSTETPGRHPNMPAAPADVAKALQAQAEAPQPSPGVTKTMPRGATAAVITAKYLWAGEYFESGLGMVDWFNQLGSDRKAYAGKVARDILSAP